MKILLKNTAAIVLLAALMANAISCKNDPREQEPQHDIHALIKTVRPKSGNGADFMKATDSLYRAGAISQVARSYLAGCHQMYYAYNYDSAVVVFQQVVDQQLSNPFDRLVQIAAAGDLVTIYQSQSSIERAAIVSLDMLKRYNIREASQDMVALDYYIRMYGNVGVGMMIRGEYADGQEHFEECYRMYDEYKSKFPNKSQFLLRRLGLVNNIVLASYYCKQYQQTVYWAERAEADITAFLELPDVDKLAVDAYQHNMLMAKSASLQILNRPDEAAAAYHQLLKTRLGATPAGIVNRADYLFAAHRYLDAAKALENLDGAILTYGAGMTLDMIQNNYLCKFQANLLAGRRDSAFAVAEQVFQGLDEAITNYKHERGSQMSTVYNMQQKDAEIAYQKAKLSQIRMLAALVTLVLFVVLFFVYDRIRRRQRLRLEEKNQQLMQANARAEESSRMKTQFIQQISHEIRTPLNLLSGFAQIVTNRGMDIDAETRILANRQILENSDRITGLVNKMLELSEVNSRTIIQLTDQIPVVQLANRAIIASGIENAAHLHFHLQDTDRVGLTKVTTNMETAVRVLGLLLDNAMKFTAPAEAHGVYKAEGDKQRVTLVMAVRDGFVQFAVEDTGIGVPAAEAEHIFDEFVQLDEYYNGAGIGLTVARSLARRLGGDVVLDTTNTPGARFVFTLPCTIS